MKRPVRIVDYNYEWSGQFKGLRQAIEKQIKDIIITIEHIGSTTLGKICMRAKGVREVGT
ncbi:MAG: GrpB family protein [candidate division WOR-3 bacterium]|nr:MAG: GrpB family protein [candidate division WOR-3 bacterium]